jgi:hypothetical protein
MSKEIISHVMTKFKLVWQNNFKKQPEKFYTDGFEELVQRWWHHIKREEDYVET